MPVKVEMLPGEPIIILSYSGLLDEETVLHAFSESARLMGDSQQQVYRIADVREGIGDFSELMHIIAKIRKGVPGSSSDPRIQGIFVGNSQLARLYADFIRQQQFGGTQIPFFPTLEEALEYVRFELRKHNNAT